MKTFLHILFFFLIVTQLQYPQWTNQNPVPDGNHLWSTFFVDDNTGWIVGSGGFIKKTTNAGLDWVQQSSGTTLTLKSIQFINQTTGWICGEEGLIIKTTDGGQNWFELTSGTTAELTDLHFCGSTVGYAVGYNGIILKTTNGGTSWTTLNSGISTTLFSVDFVDNMIGYAVGASLKFLKTTDGGMSWNVSTPMVTAGSTFNCVDFIDANIGCIGSGDHYMGDFIHKTTDGGQTWILAGTFRPNSRTKSRKEHFNDNMYDTQVGIRSIYFKDANNGYATGGTYDGWDRHIYTTTDAGTTWQSKYGYSEQTGLLSVFVTSGGKGWAVGYYGVIYMTEDNGSSWKQILSGITSYWTGDWILSVYLVNDSIGWASGFRKGTEYLRIILKTTNGGKIWKTQSQTGYYYSRDENETYFIDENIGWSRFMNYGSYITFDGGDSWGSFEMPWYNVSNSQYFFINNTVGWKITDKIYKTTNGGNSWLVKNNTSGYGIFFSDAETGWVCGQSGLIMKSTDGGESWYNQISGTTQTLDAIRFYDNNIGMCVGMGGTVLTTTNGGDNWSIKTTGVTYQLRSIQFANSATWILNGNFFTSDGGSSWETLGNGTHFTQKDVGWTWDNNNILKYIEEPIPIVTLTSPNGGEIWKSGWQRNITWSSENISSINLFYSTNGGSNWNTIASNIDASSGSYNWTIPILTWFINLNCKVKIEDASNSSVYDESDNNFIIWHFCNIIQYANLGQRIIDFLETNIDISLNVTTSDNISVTYYPYETPTGGTLPSGVIVLSDYYWQVTSTNLIFSNGKMIVPILTLRGVTDATKLVWLKRTNPGDDWENIGGIVSGDNLESTVLFNSFSEFAIGSTDPVNPLPVELYSFEASVNGSSVNLKWKTKTEVKNYGFEVERCLDNSWEKIGFVQGYGNSNSPKSYSFSDNNPFGGSKFQYRLKQLDTDGEFEYSNEIEVEILPNKFALFQNYPNPFNPATKIRYQLPEESKVVIKIYDILGTEVVTLVNDKKEAGTYEVELNATSLSSGTYIYRIVAGEFVETKKMVLMK